MPEIAIAPFLSTCPAVVTLGVRATLDDYPDSDLKLLRSAPHILFPTPRFSEVFHAAGIRTFPGVLTYRYQRSRVLQVVLMQYMRLPHARMRVYFGRQKDSIPRDFPFPMIVMPSQNHPDTRFIANDMKILRELAGRYNPLVVQEFLRPDETVRVISVRSICLGVQRRSGPAFEPADPDDPFLDEVLRMNQYVTRRAGLDDIAIEWGRKDGRWLITAMTRPPVRWSAPDGIVDRHKWIAKRIECGLFDFQPSLHLQS